MPTDKEVIQSAINFLASNLDGDEEVDDIFRENWGTSPMERLREAAKNNGYEVEF